jgi:hypothetical protein
MEVLATAGKLQLSKLRYACMAHLEKSVNAVNVCVILRGSTHMNLAPLSTACTSFIISEGKAVLASEGFKDLLEESVILIILSKKLCATEEEVFKEVMVWAGRDGKKKWRRLYK